jgi:hypothetical protein
VLALTVVEREDISRGLASGSSTREIAKGLERAGRIEFARLFVHDGADALAADLHDAKSADPRLTKEAMTHDDWRWNADQFNRMGERVNAAGIKFGYHNHTAEFRALNGVVIYDELRQLSTFPQHPVNRRSQNTLWQCHPEIHFPNSNI